MSETSTSYKNPNIEGWMSEPELQWLFELAKRIDSIAEIGVWKGRSVHALLSGGASVTAVDHFDGPNITEDSPQSVINMKAQAPNQYDEFMQNVGHLDKLEVFKGDSISASKVLGLFDVVFIDADHHYEAVKNDVMAWLPHARKLICGHDLDEPDVLKAVSELLPGFENPVGSIWTYVIE